ncbi:putative WRKY transcription factor 19 [Phytophthora citrophthora]|uniref:WRKY transcription factor 19 n=1 Tax=Phytophthora citrophthora TaxID=4793 RepID=A0AAD9LV16_9STRA|nr:putative WRKY transcription factor 19 [Phytophthora citrophthora]
MRPPKQSTHPEPRCAGLSLGAIQTRLELFSKWPDRVPLHYSDNNQVAASSTLCSLSQPRWMLLFDPIKHSPCMKNSANSDDVDMNAAWPASNDQARSDAQSGALPVLQLPANRHHLAAIMNTDASAVALVGQVTASSKSSLAFILGGNADEDQAHATGASFGTRMPGFALQSWQPWMTRTDRVFAGFILVRVAADLAIASDIAATENRAANVPAPAAVPSKSTVKKSRICKFENCTRYVVNRGLCIGHGGGKRCAVVGCTSSAKNLGVCWKHGKDGAIAEKGGFMICTDNEAPRSALLQGVRTEQNLEGFVGLMAEARNLSRKCSEENCTKTAVSHGLCWAHGGGKRCVVEGCRKPAYERNGNLCSLHQAAKPAAVQKPAKR